MRQCGFKKGTAMTYDFKKDNKEFYTPCGKPEAVNVTPENRTGKVERSRTETLISHPVKNCNMLKNVANILTAGRIILSVILLHLRTFSPAFITVYILAGITDMLDGTVARKTNSVSSFGSKLDTAADICFASAALFKIKAELSLPLFIWIWIASVAALKAVNIAVSLTAGKGFPAVHGKLNRITGLLLFVFPFVLPFGVQVPSASAMCALASVAAIHESATVFKTVRDKRKQK